MPGKKAPDGMRPNSWWRRHLLWKLLILACIVYLAFFSKGSFMRWLHSENKVQPQRRELEHIRAQSDSLEALNNRLNAEDRFEVEKQARDWGMINRGDTVFHFRSEEENSEKNQKRD